MVTDFGTTCDFLLMININLHPISHRFRVILDYWSDFRFRQRVSLFNALVWVNP